MAQLKDMHVEAFPSDTIICFHTWQVKLLGKTCLVVVVGSLCGVCTRMELIGMIGKCDFSAPDTNASILRNK